MTMSAKFWNYCLLYIRMVLRWIALDAVIQENAQICVACRMLGFWCSKQGRIHRVKEGGALDQYSHSLVL